MSDSREECCKLFNDTNISMTRRVQYKQDYTINSLATRGLPKGKAVKESSN